MGTALTNKYAEGLPKKRYYGGCEVVDEVEQLAIDRAKALFKAEHVNVQPHAGAQANMAAYLAVAKPGDTLLGLALDRKSTRLNSSHRCISYAVFCLKKKRAQTTVNRRRSHQNRHNM